MLQPLYAFSFLPCLTFPSLRSGDKLLLFPLLILLLIMGSSVCPDVPMLPPALIPMVCPQPAVTQWHSVTHDTMMAEHTGN